MATSNAWTVTGPNGRVRRFATRSLGREYARARGGRKAGYTTGEYQLRVPPKVAAGIPRDVARGHRKGNAVIIPRHRTRGGAVVRKQWTIGAAGSGEEVTLAQALKRLRAFKRANPDLDVVGLAIHGKPYRFRDMDKEAWLGGLMDIRDLEDRITLALEGGATLANEIQWVGDMPLWQSIDEITFYRPGEAE